MQGLAPRQRQICATVLVAFCWGLSGHVGRAQQPGSTEPKPSAAPTITKEPAPQAYVVNFGSAAVSFNLQVWTDQYEDWIQMRSRLAVAVDEALNRENIAIA